MAGRLEGRVAVVTGAATGIGAATARRLAADGARVALLDVSKQVEAVAADIGDGAVAVLGDVSTPEANQALVDAAVERFGTVDAAFLNAGIASFGSTLDLPLEDFDRVVAINLRGVFCGLQAVGRAMADAGGGAIVVTSSVAGRRGIPATIGYAATKHGVLGLVKTAAIDLAAHGIRVNAVCPGTIDTPILGPFHADEEQLDAHFGRLQALGRIGKPEEVGAAVSFLLSDDASFVSGEVLTVDGGQANMLHLHLSPAFMAEVDA